MSEKCACKSDDRYECWSVRYGTGMIFRCEAVEADGGPCECGCHHEAERDEALDSIGWFG